MPDRSAYLGAWGAENTVPYPREVWLDVLPAPASVYPSIDFLPIDLSAVYTSYVQGEVKLYDQVSLQIGSDAPIRFMLIGAVPADPDTWYVMHADSGEVVLIDTAEPTLETVNTTFADFAEFLYHLGRFIDADTGGPGRAARAAELKRTLGRIDPGAFATGESWWSAVIAQLSSAG